MDAKSIVANYAVENGAYDLAGLDALIADLRSQAKDIRASQKEVIAKQKVADKAVAAEAGKEYYNGLEIGQEFDILIAGKPVRVPKIATKSKVAGSAACAIVGWVDDGSMGKSANRYLGFDKVIVPADAE